MGDDNHIYMWRASDGALLLRLARHHGMVTSVAWSADSTWLASGSSGSDGGKILVWNARSGECVLVVTGHPEVVSALMWVPMGGMVVSGGSDGKLRWWDVQSGECLRVQEAHQGMVKALKVNPNGSLLASCGEDGAIMLWNLQSGEHRHTLRRDRPYERLNITGIKGLTKTQLASLRALGAVSSTAMNDLYQLHIRFSPVFLLKMTIELNPNNRRFPNRTGACCTSLVVLETIPHRCTTPVT